LVSSVALCRPQSSIGHCVALENRAEYKAMMARTAGMPKTRFGDG
jgi:hypothetical protein